MSQNLRERERESLSLSNQSVRTRELSKDGVREFCGDVCRRICVRERESLSSRNQSATFESAGVRERGSL